MKNDNTFKRFVLHSFFPERCPSCDVVVNFGELFCEECKNDIEYAKGDLCEKCFCIKTQCQCKSTDMQFERVAAPFFYKGSIRNSLLSLKDERNELLVDFFAKEMAHCVMLRFRDIKFDCIAPVPMHPEKLKRRGYNQSALIAQNLADLLDVKYNPDLLFQTTLNKTQHDLDYSGRQENVSGVYKAIPGYDYENVLLVDDIITTGFTLSECAEALKNVGIKRVYGIGAAKSELDISS